MLLKNVDDVSSFPVAFGASVASAETTVGCPLSLVVDEAQIVFALLDSPSPGVRVELRDIGLPVAGSLGRRVITHFHRESDRTEPGRGHDEIVFDWDATSFFLPNCNGVLRFRSDTIVKTRLVLAGVYVPPFGRLGALFDRFVGRKLARATLAAILQRLARDLETLWAAEQARSVARFGDVGISAAARIADVGT